MKIKHCQWCDTQFETEIAYQIYCSSSCREAATKEKISQRYIQARRSRRIGKDRRCTSCNSLLSAYNDDVLCSECNVNPIDVKKALKDIRKLANGKSE
jgi:hypothetical protein